MYKAKRKEARLNNDTVSPIIHATQAPLITIVDIWKDKTACIVILNKSLEGKKVGPKGLEPLTPRL